jgi:hypothetical protein
LKVSCLIYFSLFALRSGSMLQVLRRNKDGGLAQHWLPWLLAEEFRHPDVNKPYFKLGSSGGLKALIEGKLDIALSHKDL